MAPDGNKMAAVLAGSLCTGALMGTLAFRAAVAPASPPSVATKAVMLEAPRDISDLQSVFLVYSECAARVDGGCIPGVNGQVKACAKDPDAGVTDCDHAEFVLPADSAAVRELSNVAVEAWRTAKGYR